jgi:hypothetical protein
MRDVAHYYDRQNTVKDLYTRLNQVRLILVGILSKQCILSRLYYRSEVPLEQERRSYLNCSKSMSRYKNAAGRCFAYNGGQTQNII